MGLFDNDAGTKGLQQIALLKSLMGAKPSPPSLSALTGQAGHNLKVANAKNAVQSEFDANLLKSNDPGQKTRAVEAYLNQMEQLGSDMHEANAYVYDATKHTHGLMHPNDVNAEIERSNTDPSKAGGGAAMMSKGMAGHAQKNISSLAQLGLGTSAAKLASKAIATKESTDFRATMKQSMEESYAAAPEYAKRGYSDVSAFMGDVYSNETLSFISKTANDYLAQVPVGSMASLSQYNEKVNNLVDDSLLRNPYASRAEADLTRKRLIKMGEDRAAGVKNADSEYITGMDFGSKALVNYMAGADVGVLGDKMASFTIDEKGEFIKNSPTYRAAIRNFSDDLRAGLSLSDSMDRAYADLSMLKQYEYNAKWGEVPKGADGSRIGYEHKLSQDDPWAAEIVDTFPNFEYAVATGRGMVDFTVKNYVTGELEVKSMDRARAAYLYGDVINGKRDLAAYRNAEDAKRLAAEGATEGGGTTTLGAKTDPDKPEGFKYNKKHVQTVKDTFNYTPPKLGFVKAATDG